MRSYAQLRQLRKAGGLVMPAYMLPRWRKPGGLDTARLCAAAAGPQTWRSGHVLVHAAALANLAHAHAQLSGRSGDGLHDWLVALR